MFNVSHIFKDSVASIRPGHRRWRTQSTRTVATDDQLANRFKRLYYMVIHGQDDGSGLADELAISQ
ncbi:hypothetical protein CBI57_22045 [Pantoea agglomerans]|nr:hypothetical protein D0A61_21550 [Pantoea agglomerans]OXH76665.1 hypothetical protein CBI57_22045 [Pantoea agglomerans]